MSKLRITLDLFAHDPQGIWFAAVRAYTHHTAEASRERVFGFIDEQGDLWDNIHETLGTEDSPNLVACFLEIWAEHTPADVGYEFIEWNGETL